MVQITHERHILQSGSVGPIMDDSRTDDAKIGVESPERERWLHENPEAMASLERGLAEAAAGKARYIGSFAQYADDPIED